MIGTNFFRIGLKQNFIYSLGYATLLAGIIYYTPYFLYRRSQEVSKKSIPAFRLIDQKGNYYQNEFLKNKLVVMDFWQIGCKPYMEKFTTYKKLNQKSEGKFLIIAVDNGKNDSYEHFKRFLAKNKDLDTSILFLYDEKGSFKDKLHVSSFPHEFVLNRKGEIIQEEIGYSKDFETIFIDYKHSLIEQ